MRFMRAQPQSKDENNPSVVITNSQPFSEHEDHLQMTDTHAGVAMPRSDPTSNQHGQNPVEYRIMILHKKPEFENVEFVSTYYARETKHDEWLKQIFTAAFAQAHPNWDIKEVTVQINPTCQSQRNVPIIIRVLPPQEAIMGT